MQAGASRHFQRAIDQGHSIFAAETQVGEKHIDLLAIHYIDRACNIRSDVHIVIILKQTSQPVTSVLLVINNENRWLYVHWRCWILDARCWIFSPVSSVHCNETPKWCQLPRPKNIAMRWK